MDRQGYERGSARGAARMVILVWLSEILLYPNTHHLAHMSLARRDVASFMKLSPERKSFCPATPNVRYIVLLRPYLPSPPTMTGISPAASAIRRPWLVATGVQIGRACRLKDCANWSNAQRPRKHQ